MMQIDTWCGVIVSAARPPCAQDKFSSHFRAVSPRRQPSQDQLCLADTAGVVPPSLWYQGVLYHMCQCFYLRNYFKVVLAHAHGACACVPDLACQCALTDRKKKAKVQ